MNSRWQANRIGLINFWYYDDQEYPFVKGRMLLRGSNGCGKSVTMQSVVPLLLDGNMSPERLDPFGTKDRKMSSYLLEEDDGREERTGYLYLEFKREMSDTYLTIGMGIRARRGKPLDKWYFSITDGRRIGRDFLLYKELGEKVTLSKKELENRIGQGGQVLDRQSEYMEYVNRRIFGFETAEEYKELVDLLIQLRTPKLSKDFKPSVINDILSDSLQPLSDEDLRPMSEAIENMDTMTMNLKSRQEALGAAERINRIFEKYSQLTLYEKAAGLCTIQDRLQKLEKEEESGRKQGRILEEEIKALEKKRQDLDARHEAMEKEKESLNHSDAVALKSQEAKLVKEIENARKVIEEKNRQLENKKEQHFSAENKKKKEENRKYEKEQEIEDLLEEMEDEAEDMAFQEHGFFQEELKEKMEEEYSYALLESQFGQTKKNIRTGLEILTETREMERQADGLMKQREGLVRQLDSAKKKLTSLETVLVETENEWKEALYSWESGNQELHLEGEMLKQFSIFADSYGEESDFAQVRQQVADVWISRKNQVESALALTDAMFKEKQKEQAQVEDELKEWENQKEPVPFREESTIQNRARLDALQIPYQEFYKVLEFGESLSEESCNHLEEALLRMGILDALVVEEQYREQVLRMESGCQDKYLFVQPYAVEHSLLDVLELNDEVNDIFSNQRLTGILGNIAYEEIDCGKGLTGISPEGIYQMGPLVGTITGEYTAGFLGTKAREKNRRKQIEECRQKLALLEQEIRELENEIIQWENRKAKLKAEYDSFPKDTDLREALKMLVSARFDQEKLQGEEKKIQEQLKGVLEELGEKKKEAMAVAGKLYLTCNYQTFFQADQAAAGYGSHLQQLKFAHEMYRMSVSAIRETENRIVDIEEDMDQLLYDISAFQREEKQKKAEYESIQEQLKLTDYEEIRERLDYCVRWLNSYPEEIQSCVKELTRKQAQADNLEEQIKELGKKKKETEEKQLYYESCYQGELALGYVELPEKMEKRCTAVYNYLDSTMKNLKKDDVIRDLNRVYFENRGFLNEYQLMQGELFADLDENAAQGEMSAKRLDISARYKGIKIPFGGLIGHLKEDIEELQDLIKDGDRELFEDILANTVSRKIRGKINASTSWVDKMNTLMGAMNTSSGLKLSLRWRSRTAEKEDQLDTRELVSLLKKDYRLMSEEEARKLSAHFRSKVEEARRSAKDTGENKGMVSFYQVMKDTLDYRKWFEFQLFYQKSGEKVKELTNSAFGTFSGGEKAMSMYVPLFSAVVAKYQGGRPDAPRLISLDEAFAGVDNRNIRDMFRLMTEFRFDFIINSQVLWGDCDTLDALAIYQLIRPENAKFVTVMPYIWNGHGREMLENEKGVEQRGEELEQAARD